MLVNVLEILRRGFPILTWSKGYNFHKAVADLVAGITIGLTLIPQSIAYASLAGLGPQYGLYSSLGGGIIYAAFGSIAELNIAPTALLSLLTFSFTQNASFGNVNAAILLCFLSGVIELLCGFLHLGFLVDFVSTPVVAAFTSAGALTIASSQVKNLLGLKFSSETFTGTWYNVIIHITEIQKWDLSLGLCCCIVLLLMRKLKDFGSPPLDDVGESQGKSSGVKKLIWFFSVARNAFVVIISAVVAYVFGHSDMKPFSLTSQVPEGLPYFSLPIAEVHNGNVTITPLDMMKELGTGIFVLPFVGILGNVAIAKAFAKGKVVDASQEMIAVGMCNLFGSFFGSYPVNASFSRAAVSNASGVKTPFAGIYTGIMVILALTFLTPYFSYIPKATLAAVIICAVVFMVEVALTKMIWKINKIDLIPFSVTLLSCLFIGIEVGILVGVCVDILFLLYMAARPKILVDTVTDDSGRDYMKVTPTSAILFPSAEFVREKIMQSSEKYGTNYKFVVVDCDQINKIDFTTARCLSAFVMDFKKIGKEVIFYRPVKLVEKVIKSSIASAQIAASKDELFDKLKGDENQLFTVTARQNNNKLAHNDATTNL